MDENESVFAELKPYLTVLLPIVAIFLTFAIVISAFAVTKILVNAAQASCN
jgi:hypothetical protein